VWLLLVAGYYARHVIIKSLLIQFLETHRKRRGEDKVQVVVLGCGFDTTYFQLKDEGIVDGNVLYVECDFEDVVQSKRRIMDMHRNEFMCYDDDDEHYRLVGADIRKLGEVKERLLSSGLDAGAPTCFLAECVLVYMEPTFSSPLLEWIASAFHESAIIMYEQFNPVDPFGQQMMQNLMVRGCPLKGIMGTLQDQKERLLSLGWDFAESKDMLTLFNHCVPSSEISRINRLEMLDEQEEWNLLLGHYCITLGARTRSPAMPYDILHTIRTPKI